MADKKVRALDVVEGAPTQVEIRVINPKKTGTLMVRPIMHPETGRIMPLVDINGNQTTFAISKAKVVLDVANEYHRQILEILKVHPVYTVTPEPKIRIINVEEEAQDTLRNIECEDEARTIVRKLSSVELANFARVLGLNTDRVSETVIKTKVYDIARETKKDSDGLTGAARIAFEWNHPDRELKELLHKARARSIVTVKSGIWYYGQQPMGDNFERAMLWLKDNEDIIPVIRREADRLK